MKEGRGTGGVSDKVSKSPDERDKGDKALVGRESEYKGRDDSRFFLVVVRIKCDTHGCKASWKDSDSKMGCETESEKTEQWKKQVQGEKEKK